MSCPGYRAPQFGFYHITRAVSIAQVFFPRVVPSTAGASRYDHPPVTPFLHPYGVSYIPDGVACPSICLAFRPGLALLEACSLRSSSIGNSPSSRAFSDVVIGCLGWIVHSLIPARALTDHRDITCYTCIIFISYSQQHWRASLCLFPEMLSPVALQQPTILFLTPLCP